MCNLNHTDSQQTKISKYKLQINYYIALFAILATSRFMLTLGTSNYFCQTPVGARLIFSMLLLGAELIFANRPPGAGLF